MNDSDSFNSISEDTDTSGFSVNEEDIDIDYRARQIIQRQQEQKQKQKRQQNQRRPKQTKQQQGPPRERAAIVQRLRSGPIKPEPYWAWEIAESKADTTVGTLSTSDTSLQLDTSTSHIAPTSNVATTLKRNRQSSKESMDPDIDTDTARWTEERLKKKQRFENEITPAVVLQRWSWVKRVCASHANLFTFPSCEEDEQVDVFYRYIYWNILIAVNHIIINTSRILSYYQHYDDAHGIERLYILSETQSLLPAGTPLSASKPIPQLGTLVETLSDPLFTAMSLFHRKHSVLTPYIVSLAMRCDELAAHMNSLHVIFDLSRYPTVHKMLPAEQLDTSH